MSAVDNLLADCQAAVAEHDPRRAVKEVLQRAVADTALRRELGEPSVGLTLLHNSADLTVLNVVWPPRMSLFPHDHRMWAAIGIYRGQEDNAFYRRQGDRAVPSGGKQLHEGDVLLLGDDVIHAVDNPLHSYTAAIHVYGGDFVAVERSQWDKDTLLEQPYDLESVHRAFAEAERRAALTAPTTPPSPA